MDPKDIVLGVTELLAWYFFFWFGLDSIRRGRNPWWAAAILLALFYVAFVTCPWVRETDAWNQL